MNTEKRGRLCAMLVGALIGLFCAVAVMRVDDMVVKQRENKRLFCQARFTLSHTAQDTMRVIRTNEDCLEIWLNDEITGMEK